LACAPLALSESQVITPSKPAQFEVSLFSDGITIAFVWQSLGEMLGEIGRKVGPGKLRL
jgi:hypothetical protein